ncbi:DUF2062 domain-containing protein [Teichococcus oryzae]|uniref:DUF2062 domain-containing protein n=1 Tax=Teichococcus oryzae TaxID=1608942 RepID=UPI0019D6A31A|nr:DUF2062 domain-containing protein [Pseudoroseomonas oryzae]
MLTQLREGWITLLVSPGGPERVARGVAAGAGAAMLPAIGLHLVLAAALALLLRGSLRVAAAACLLFGNPLTHAVLLPLEFALGRLLLPTGAEFLPDQGPAWLLALLPAAEETLLGGLILAVLAGALGWFLAHRALGLGGTAQPLRVIHLNGPINSGKSSTGQALAARIADADFIDGDADGLPAHLPEEQRWAGALGRILRQVAGTAAPCLIVAYPLDDTGYRRLRAACVARGAALSVVTLAPPLDVALGARGGRGPDAEEQARIRAMYAEGYHSRAFSDVTLDNAGMTPDEAALRILAALDHARGAAHHARH